MKKVTQIEKFRQQIEAIAEKLQLTDVELTRWNPGDGWTRYQITGYYKSEYLPKQEFASQYMSKKELELFIENVNQMTRFNIALDEPKHLVIIARRFFDNGNTYHSCQVYINGQLIDENKYEYGYDEAYLQTAQELLEKHGYKAETYSNGVKEGGWRWFDKNFTSWMHTVTDVKAKKYL